MSRNRSRSPNLERRSRIGANDAFIPASIHPIRSFGMIVRIRIPGDPPARLREIAEWLRFTAWFVLGLSCVLGLVVVTLYPVGIW